MTSGLLTDAQLRAKRAVTPWACQHGYTIVELLVVMVVLSLLALAAMPLVELSVKRGKERDLNRALWEIRSAIDAYHDAYEKGRIANHPDVIGYPATLQVLVDGVPNAKNTKETSYFLRRIPRDPFAPPDLKPASNWVLRSYASPPNKPSAGDDIYDIHSKAEGKGMNGIPYGEW